MRVSFHGAAGGKVSGSCHRIEFDKKGKDQALLDCGSFMAEKGSQDFGFDPQNPKWLLLSHGHWDHFGRIVSLVKKGFNGEIIATAPTKAITEFSTLDSARYNRRRENRFASDSPEQYTVEDVRKTISLFGREAVYGKPIKLSKNVTAVFFDAGHMLGSASVLLEINEGGIIRRLTFSGDIGNSNKPIICNPTLPPKSDFVIMETLYGDRPHRPFIQSTEEFYNAINDAFKRKGNVVIPAFAVSRSQEILYLLRAGLENKKLPKRMVAFLDSPSAIKATKVFRNYPDFFDEEAKELVKRGKDPFSFPNLTFTEKVSDSKQINDVKNGAVIVAASGMGTGGRIMYHLKQNLPRPESSVVVANFAAKGTLVRDIVDGKKIVNILGEEIPVRAKIYTINGFSGHGGQTELVNWQGATGTPATTFLVHAEEKQRQAFAQILKARGLNIEMPDMHESFKI